MKRLQILFAIITLSLVLTYFLQTFTNYSTSSKILQKNQKISKNIEELKKKLERFKNIFKKQEKIILNLLNENSQLKEKNLEIQEKNKKLKNLLTQLYQKQNDENMLKTKNNTSEKPHTKEYENLSPYKLEQQDEDMEEEGDIEGISKKLLVEYESVSIGKTRKNMPAFFYIVLLGSVDQNQRHEVVELNKSYAAELEILKKKHNSKKTDRFISDLKNLQRTYYKLIFPILREKQKTDLSTILKTKISKKTGN